MTENTSDGQPVLFDMEPVIVEPAPPGSATVRRTKRQTALLETGRHPLSTMMGISLWLHPEAAPASDRDAPGRRCGNCRWRQLVHHHNRSYPKCFAPGLLSAESYERLGPPRFSHSEASDTRGWWPACSDHEWGDPALSPDAARCVPEVGP